MQHDPNPPKRHLVGYVRVSMSDQNTQRQVDELVKYGVAECDIFRDSASGKNMKRPGWRDLWRDVREGDMLVILSIDRLGRNLVEVVQTVEALAKRGVGLKVLNGEIDTTTPTGRLVFHMAVAMAQWERELIVERTKHGLERARERGRIGGRPERMADAQVVDAIRRSDAGEHLSKIAAELKVGRNTVYSRVKEYRAGKRSTKKEPTK